MKQMFHFERKRDCGFGFCQNQTLTDPPRGSGFLAKKNWLFAYLRPSFLICIFLITGGEVYHVVKCCKNKIKINGILENAEKSNKNLN